MAERDDLIRFDIDGRVARLELHRPDRLNALNDDLRLALRDAFTVLEERPDVSVLMLSGAGRAFSAGADLRTSAYPPVEGDWVTRRHRTGTWQRLLEQLDRLPQVSVAALHGHVIGGGALLAGCCDLRIAADTTTLRIPELLIGMPLAWAGVPVLAREVGLAVTRDWVMTGRAVSADELLRTGFVTRLVTAADLDGAVAAIIDELLAVPPGPLAMTKAMTGAIGRTMPGMAAAWADADIQQWTFTEDEYRDAIRRHLHR
ncbi:MAG: enoyl-CoA hydratase/isomerase family protein [Actinobacteria bacterium]|nr:enoyl-CoA hydratase/isomerase family protein [Actinomycetota bacterium]